ncbi:hypothetical protein SCP_0505090 [Sparassis crispa]|uniref:non-specific serine/threonine protein kinase n=1 Tax=Sparassis crispa TaxID=139825 RepID=A0A401GMQ0_9APHY|nr:hypothetical protein SCP_0505090 [Sparassis crispa]GBE83460.1 hypothetical protein SCP_0505090 [Sparassis crispa]
MTSRALEDRFPARPGDTRLNDRYKIVRKVGTGVFSDTWLVQDEKPDIGKYHAAKILTRDATRRHESGESQELQFLKKIAECEDIDGLPVLRDDFVISGPRGDHMCFIMDLLSTNVSSLRLQSPTKSLPSYLVKNIISLTLQGLMQLHSLDIIHTDVKTDNIMVGGVGDDARIETFLTSEPVAVEGEFELDGEKYPLCRPQPIPHQFSWNSSPHHAEIITITLIGLGQAQWAGKQPTVDQFSAPSLRAPEIILQSSFGPKLDIWSIGCITFELLTGRWLFNPEEGEDWTVEDDHLAKMMELTGESFTPEVLQHARRRQDFFDDSGKLLRISEVFPGSLESALGNYKILDEKDIKPAAEFIRSCLHLDPSKRPSAEELQLAPWLEDAFHC